MKGNDSKGSAQPPSGLRRCFHFTRHGSCAVRGISEALFDSQMLHFHTIIFSINCLRMPGCGGHVGVANICTV